MCDFDGDFEGDDFMEDDYFEDCLGDLETEDPPDGGADVGGESEDAGSVDDEFTAKDAFFIGGAMGWGYEEGREEAERKRLLKKDWRKSEK